MTTAIETTVQDHMIQIKGYVTTDAYEPLKASLAEVSGDRVVLSFDEKSFTISTGLAVLMDPLLPLKDDKQITLVHPKDHFRRVFEITGMARDFGVEASVPA